ncbi:MAG: AMP-binding protein [Desertimonas sp.]
MNIRSLLEISAVNYGTRLAVWDQERELTFVGLEASAKRLARAVAASTQQGARVAILSQNRTEYVECLIGVPSAGRILTLLNYRLARPELVRISQDAEPEIVIVEPEYLDTGREIVAAVAETHTLVVLGDRSHEGTVGFSDWLAIGDGIDDSSIRIDEHDGALLIYTSGTTGVPKGALLSHHNNIMSTSGWSIASGVRLGREISLVPFPMCHIAGAGAVGNSFTGTTMIVRRAYDPEDFMAMVQRFGVTAANFAPTMLDSLLRHPRFNDYDLSSLRKISYGGAVMPIELLRRLGATFPGAQFSQGFGQTETTAAITCLDAEAHHQALAGNDTLLSSVGRPTPYSAVRVVDTGMTDVADGEVGEIVARGENNMLGYWRRPEANEEVFRGGWLHTGDLGRWMPGGYLEVVDRLKDMIITGGENVYSREVENVIGEIDGVLEVAVIGVPDQTWGENVCACIVREPGAALSTEHVVGRCRERLAGYKKPKLVVFVEELPKNASGKILKRELRDSEAVLASAR